MFCLLAACLNTETLGELLAAPTPTWLVSFRRQTGGEGEGEGKRERGRERGYRCPFLSSSLPFRMK